MPVAYDNPKVCPVDWSDDLTRSEAVVGIGSHVADLLAFISAIEHMFENVINCVS